MGKEFNWKEQPWKYPFTTNPATRCAECGELLTVDPKMHPCGPEGFLERDRKWVELNAMTPEPEPRKKNEYKLQGRPHLGGTLFSYDNWLMPSYQDIVTQMEEQTGCTFEFLGCFMDVCSFRTNAEIHESIYTVIA
jgi:hypothetical protein